MATPLLYKGHLLHPSSRAYELYVEASKGDAKALAEFKQHFADVLDKYRANYQLHQSPKPV